MNNKFELSWLKAFRFENVNKNSCRIWIFEVKKCFTKHTHAHSMQSHGLHSFSDTFIWNQLFWKENWKNNKQQKELITSLTFEILLHSDYLLLYERSLRSKLIFWFGTYARLLLLCRTSLMWSFPIFTFEISFNG